MWSTIKILNYFEKSIRYYVPSFSFTWSLIIDNVIEGISSHSLY